MLIRKHWKKFVAIFVVLTIIAPSINFDFGNSKAYASGLSTPNITSPSDGASLSKGSVKVSWSSISGADYHLFAAIDETSEDKFLNNTAVFSTKPTLTPSPSPTLAPVTLTAPILTSPNNGSIIRMSNSNFTVSWETVPGAVIYYYSVLKNGTGSNLYPAGNGGTTSTSVSLATSMLEANTSYTVKVTAQNNSGTTSSSTVLFVTGSDTLTPPEILTPSKGSTIYKIGSNFVLSWEPVPGAEIYYYSVLKNGAGSNLYPAGNGGTTSTSILLSTGALEANTSYTVKVTAQNNSGATSSSTVNVVTGSDAFTAAEITSPSKGSTISLSNPSFTVSWGTVPGAVLYYYSILKNGTGSNLYPAGNEGTTSTSISLTTSVLEANTSYTIKVTAQNNIGITSSSTINVVTEANKLINLTDQNVSISLCDSNTTVEAVVDFGGEVPADVVTKLVIDDKQEITLSWNGSSIHKNKYYVKCNPSTFTKGKSYKFTIKTESVNSHINNSSTPKFIIIPMQVNLTDQNIGIFLCDNDSTVEAVADFGGKVPDDIVVKLVVDNTQEFCLSWNGSNKYMNKYYAKCDPNAFIKGKEYKFLIKVESLYNDINNYTSSKLIKIPLKMTLTNSNIKISLCDNNTTVEAVADFGGELPDDTTVKLAIDGIQEIPLTFNKSNKYPFKYYVKCDANVFLDGKSYIFKIKTTSTETIINNKTTSIKLTLYNKSSFSIHKLIEKGYVKYYDTYSIGKNSYFCYNITNLGKIKYKLVSNELYYKWKTNKQTYEDNFWFYVDTNKKLVTDKSILYKLDQIYFANMKTGKYYNMYLASRSVRNNSEWIISNIDQFSNTIPNFVKSSSKEGGLIVGSLITGGEETTVGNVIHNIANSYGNIDTLLNSTADVLNQCITSDVLLGMDKACWYFKLIEKYYANGYPVPKNYENASKIVNLYIKGTSNFNASYSYLKTVIIPEMPNDYWESFCIVFGQMIVPEFYDGLTDSFEIKTGDNWFVNMDINKANRIKDILTIIYTAKDSGEIYKKTTELLSLLGEVNISYRNYVQIRDEQVYDIPFGEKSYITATLID